MTFVFYKKHDFKDFKAKEGDIIHLMRKGHRSPLVYQYSDGDWFLKCYYNIAEASKKLGVKPSDFMWMLKEEKEINVSRSSSGEVRKDVKFSDRDIKQILKKLKPTIDKLNRAIHGNINQRRASI